MKQGNEGTFLQGGSNLHPWPIPPEVCLPLTFSKPMFTEPHIEKEAPKHTLKQKASITLSLIQPNTCCQWSKTSNLHSGFHLAPSLCDKYHVESSHSLVEEYIITSQQLLTFFHQSQPKCWFSSVPIHSQPSIMPLSDREGVYSTRCLSYCWLNNC